MIGATHPTHLTRFIWFCIGVLTGQVGIPLLMHLFYWTLMGVFWWIVKCG